MADTQVLEACALRRRGSSPLSRTKKHQEKQPMSQTITQPDNTKITLNKTEAYRENYANSVQVRLAIWDFLLVFGTLEQQAADAVTIDNFQGIFLSPQQAKALSNLLTHNVAQYEKTFGEISLDGRGPGQQFVPPANGPVH
jgi:hypothetical protein